MRGQTKPERTGEKQDRSAGGRFLPGQSGNPASRPVGRRNRGVELFDEVIDDGEFRKIIQKATGLAAEGNVPVLIAILRLKVPPPQATAQPIDLPKLATAADATKAMGIITDAAARGEIDAAHARAMTATIAVWLEAYKVTDLNERLRRIEEIQEGQAR